MEYHVFWLWESSYLNFSEIGSSVFFNLKSWWKVDIFLVFLNFSWYSRAWKIWFFVQWRLKTVFPWNIWKFNNIQENISKSWLLNVFFFQIPAAFIKIHGLNRVQSMLYSNWVSFWSFSSNYLFFHFFWNILWLVLFVFNFEKKPRVHNLRWIWEHPRG